MANNIKFLLPIHLLYFAALSLAAMKCQPKPSSKTDTATNQKDIEDTDDADDSGFESDGETAENSAAEGKSPEGEDAKNAKNQEENGEEVQLTTEEKLANAQEKIESLEQEKEALQRRGSSGDVSVKRRCQQRLHQVEADITGLLNGDLVDRAYIMEVMRRDVCNYFIDYTTADPCRTFCNEIAADAAAGAADADAIFNNAKVRFIYNMATFVVDAGTAHHPLDRDKVTDIISDIVNNVRFDHHRLAEIIASNDPEYKYTYPVSEPFLREIHARLDPKNRTSPAYVAATAQRNLECLRAKRRALRRALGLNP